MCPFHVHSGHWALVTCLERSVRQDEATIDNNTQVCLTWDKAIGWANRDQATWNQRTRFTKQSKADYVVLKCNQNLRLTDEPRFRLRPRFNFRLFNYFKINKKINPKRIWKDKEEEKNRIFIVYREILMSFLSFIASSQFRESQLLDRINRS